jgi:hypothetical protein
MKKVHSKSTITKKNNTIGPIPESKKNSRVHKPNSCVKIYSHNTEQQSANLTLQPTLSKSNMQNYSQKISVPLSHANYGQIQSSNLHLIDRPQSHRKTKNDHNAKNSI